MTPAEFKVIYEHIKQAKPDSVIGFWLGENIYFRGRVASVVREEGGCPLILEIRSFSRNSPRRIFTSVEDVMAVDHDE